MPGVMAALLNLDHNLMTFYNTTLNVRHGTRKNTTTGKVPWTK